MDASLLVGCRGLPGGSSLARLLHADRGVRNPAAVARLEHWEILIWADAYHDRTGRWPTAASGPIPEAPGERWAAVDAALRSGTRGLPGGDSLARLLARRRGARNHADRPPLTTAQILAWADAHYRRTGDWPTAGSGAVADAPGETWCAVAHALRDGRRGLPGGSSLARLLEAERGVRDPAAVHSRSAGTEYGFRNRAAVPMLTTAQILAWADAHHARTGRWPTRRDGPIPGTTGETWFAVEGALSVGARGLAGGSSLAQFLAAHRGVRNRKALPALTVGQIRGWVTAHYRRTGTWPGRDSGPIPEAPGETWSAVSNALKRGGRGLPGGSSLATVVRECRGAAGRRPGG
ncbi:MAG: hypothetical protein JWO38_2141 [Gemmataceae bacterium]|nr:hypothetical protein [Gemmataceae bacterium]